MTEVQRPLRIGTRASALAGWQANWVSSALRKTDVEIEIVPISTHGDRRRGSIQTAGTQGLFTKEIQRALLEKHIDVAVHSLKDLPTEPIAGLVLGAVPQRESSRDVLISSTADSLAGLPQRSRVGTGSMRRRAQLLHARTDLTIRDIRGNVDTRLRKLDEGEYDAIILAEAGLRRLQLIERITEVLPETVMMPAVGQGALGIECREDDDRTRGILQAIDHRPSHMAVQAERTLLASLRGGCLAPVGARAKMVEERIALDAVVLDPDGTRRLFASAEADDAAAAGQQVAQTLLDQGAATLIAAARDSGPRSG